jgi:hypothetical protein
MDAARSFHADSYARGSERALPSRDRQGVGACLVPAATVREFPWACWPTKNNEDAFVGRRTRLPHVGSLWGRRFRLPTRVSNRVAACALLLAGYRYTR